jgi:Kef-type K+ transport system membrane component KefB
MRQTSKTLRLVWLIIIIVTFVLPLLVFWGGNYWPSGTRISVLFWISYALCPSCSLGYLLRNYLRSRKEKDEPTSQIMTIVFLAGSFIIPLINFFFTFERSDSTGWFVVLLIIDIILYAAMLIGLIYLGFASRQFRNTYKQCESKSDEVIKGTSDFENSDGSFHGSRIYDQTNKK